MKRNPGLIILFCCIMIFIIDNCVNIGNPQGIGPTGYLYSHYELGFSENQTPEKESKFGKACIYRYFFLYTVGDSSIQVAAKNGGITQIKSINKEAKNYLTLYSSLCTLVSGI